MAAKRLAGKVALVTGASSGIGEATALALAAEGAAVVVAARRAERLHALVQHVHQAGGQALALVTDIASDQGVHEMVQQAYMRWQRLDILVNNAGVMFAGPIAGAETAEWRHMVEVNLLGLMYATHAALPIMQQQRSGHIVNVSSARGRNVKANYGVYSATKWAVNAFSEALRQEVHSQRIRVTVIEPGATESELDRHTTDPEMKRQIAARSAAMESLSSEDVAAAILYAVTQPSRVSVNELLIRPIDQE
jgi:NADP-dependent 3-hydroxy acid dehydrogenase YdfG